jgi:hypothetical protein
MAVDVKGVKGFAHSDDAESHARVRPGDECRRITEMLAPVDAHADAGQFVKDEIVKQVASRTGLSEDMAKQALDQQQHHMNAATVQESEAIELEAVRDAYRNAVEAVQASLG